MFTVLGWLGIGLATAGLVLGAWQFKTLSTREITIGKVTELIPERGAKGGTTYRTVAVYQDHQGHAHTYRSSFTASPAPYDVGEDIRISFPKHDPAAGEAATFGAGFGPPWILVGVGVLLLWIAWGFTAGRGWIETAFPATVPSQTGQVKVP